MRLPSLFSDGMVLQRGRSIPVWGIALPGEEVSVTLATESRKTTANADGRWQIDLPPQNAGGPLEMTVTGSGTTDTITIRDIYVGEVWLASGQSNMHWTFHSSHGVINNAEELVAAKDLLSRQFTVAKIGGAEPANDAKGAWLPATAEGLLAGGDQGASAVAYFFARELRRTLNVPVGILNASLGGTLIEQWSPGGELYHAMIHPLLPFQIRGAIWYQGESNLMAGDGIAYVPKQKDLIAAWRSAWGDEFPFYFAQLAPYIYSTSPGMTADSLPTFWEAQTRTLALPKTSMVGTVDLVDDVTDIHPRNKQDVGRRLARLALSRTYGNSEELDSGPLYTSHRIEGTSVRLHFAYAGGLKTRGGKALASFTIADESGTFVPADAVIDGETVVIRSDRITHPAAVRYSWSENPTGNLVNAAGLPAVPFRTDSA